MEYSVSQVKETLMFAWVPNEEYKECLSWIYENIEELMQAKKRWDRVRKIEKLNVERMTEKSWEEFLDSHLPIIDAYLGT